MLSIGHHEARLPQISTEVLRGIDTESHITGVCAWLDSRLYGTNKSRKSIYTCCFSYNPGNLPKLPIKCSICPPFAVGQLNTNSVHCVSGSYSYIHF